MARAALASPPEERLAGFRRDLARDGGPARAVRLARDARDELADADEQQHDDQREDRRSDERLHRSRRAAAALPPPAERWEGWGAISAPPTCIPASQNIAATIPRNSTTIPPTMRAIIAFVGVHADSEVSRSTP